MISNSMRMTGFASGMDIGQMVDDLMEAERQPLQKMEQDQLWLTQQRDAYREVNAKMSEFESMFLDMRMSSTYNSTKATSSSDAISVSARSNADEANYQVNVNELATAAVNISDADLDLEAAVGEDLAGEHTFQTFDEDGQEVTHTLTLNADDTYEEVFDKINEASDGAVRAFYNESSGQIFIERTETGQFNPDDNGAEIQFGEGTIFTDTFNLDSSEEHGGQDARFTYNGVELTSRSNSYELNGATLQFHQTTDQAATISIEQDIDGAVEEITNFVDKYNELVGYMNEKVNEPRNRDYPPLTEDQRRAMSESEIELWEEQSKSGELRSDGILRGAISGMRSAWYESVDNDETSFNAAYEIGITTVNAVNSPRNDQGKLEVDEQELRRALEEDSEGVYRMLSSRADDDSRGVLSRVKDQLDNSMDRIRDRAGRATQTDHQYTMGRELMNMADRMANFERRMQQTEERYWDQFSRMERAMQEANNQSAQMQQAMGGMM
ncbi:flagellar filament capping protein FliD [Alkalibacillus haloalkaliphilus]|uniref:flagellar filament capping protein FliD n=1 Tax=Alkalibacillus haloalkaliphilus TaxID=94136 RepID=UPI0029361338|nr:flagellar filament capping protein FliD [Alkalibacillus haloalkaliphilus]MDV2582852.1 flagellar filament capping protein FliD [Alkalibacillus haloalkaliphilus]